MSFFNKSSDQKVALRYENQGIPEKDLSLLLKKVKEIDIVLLIRPVEPLTKTLHEQGTFPTKNFHIKGKSSSWGAWAGFIPVEQAYSKLSGAKPEKIEKANKDVQDCINQRFAQAAHLTITEERFQELQSKKIIHLEKEKEKEYLVILCPFPNIDAFKRCYAKKINVGTATEYAIYTDIKKPFEVLADMHLNKPLIADYDLLAIFHPWENYSQDNMRPNPDVILRERYRRLSRMEQRRSTESSENFYAREIQNLGNIAPETIKIISELNKALNKGNHLECIHHNDDAGSPSSDPRANYPITALLPQLKGLPEIVLINSTNEFVDFIKIIKQYKYRVEINPLWEQAVQLAAKEDFYQKIVHFENKFNNTQGLKSSLRLIFKAIDLTDSTLIEKITDIILLIIKQHDEIKFENLFQFIQSCLLTNSVLVSQWCSLLDKLLGKNLLTDEIFFKIQNLMTELKEDIPGFSELPLAMVNFEDFESLQQDKSEETLNKRIEFRSRIYRS